MLPRRVPEFWMQAHEVVTWDYFGLLDYPVSYTELKAARICPEPTMGMGLLSADLGILASGSAHSTCSFCLLRRPTRPDYMIIASYPVGVSTRSPRGIIYHAVGAKWSDGQKVESSSSSLHSAKMSNLRIVARYSCGRIGL